MHSVIRPRDHTQIKGGSLRLAAREATNEVYVTAMEVGGMPVGRGGTWTLSVNGKTVAEQSLPHTQPFIWAWDDTFDVGLDTGTSVDDADYAAPFPFTAAPRGSLAAPRPTGDASSGRS